MKSSDSQRIKVKATVIIDMEVNNGYTLEEAIDNLVVNMHCNHTDSAYVFDSELTYYEPLYQL
jgi:hypothetical protein